MTLLGKKRQLLETAEQKRRKWDPPADSFHYKVYSWWMDQSGHAPKRDNFCHYWRVALIWGPLRWISQPLRNRRVQQLLMVLVTILAGIGIVTAATTWQEVALITGMGVVGLSYMIGSGLILWHHLETYYGTSEIPWLSDRGYGVIALLTLLSLPGSIVLLVIILFGAMIDSFFEEHSIHTKLFSPIRQISWLVPATIMLALAFVYFLSTAWWFHSSRMVLLGLAITAGVLGAIVAIAFGCSLLEDYRNQRVESRPARPTGSAPRKARKFRPIRATISVLALIWAALRAWKMGICPIVDLPERDV